MNDAGAGVVVAHRSIVNIYFRRRYAILFYSLLLTFAAAPLLDALGFQGALLELFLAANLLGAVFPIGNPVVRRVLVAVLGVSFFVRLGASVLSVAAVSYTILAIWMIVALLAAAGALRFALRASVIDSEHVYAALSAYLLAGNFFGVCYWVLEQVWAGSLAGPADQAVSLAGAIYFSFVTLATLGYGDLVPRSLSARGLAIVEAVAGQLYLAVLVARLVSLYVRETPRRRGQGGSMPE